MTFDANMFNFDAMKEAVGADPFAQETNKYGKDDRFYTLSKDKEGNGAAIIRFLPDSEKGMIQRLYTINTTIVKNGKKRFVSEFSPTSAGMPCPFQERWQSLWNEGVKDDVKDASGNVTKYGAKTFSRGTTFVTNIKVLKDPANPENEGKIFLFRMSGKMKDKIQMAVNPSEQDRALGASPKEMFNPIRGNSFRLVAKKGANGQINYDSSEVVSDVTSIYDSVEAAIEDIKSNTYKLSDLLKAEAFMSYEELEKKLAWVTHDTAPVASKDTLTAEVATAQAAPAEVQEAPQTAQTTPVQEVKEPEPQPEQKKADDLDSLLDGLM